MTDTLPPTLSIPVPKNETERLAALHRYRILDTPPEAAFDRITRMAARLFDMPIALISLVDESRAWFKSCIGFGANEVPRDATLCSFAVLSDEPLIVPDTRKDDRFACNPFVQSEPGVRFYAGAPLISQDGFNLGTLCLLDGQSRESLTPEQEATLVDLAAMVVDELELRLAVQKMAQVDAALLEITQGVASLTGEAFFGGLVQHFAKVLNTDYVYIGLVESDNPLRIKTIATCAKGEIVGNLEYPLQETPCWEVIRQGKICCYPRSVQAHFPKAPLLKPLSVESYAATPFFDATGTSMGLLGIMDGKPMENVDLVQSLLTIFADRIATELERQQAEIDLRESEEKYRRLFESIDEGYLLAEVLFDENDRPIDILYLEANPAVQRITGLDVVGKRLRELDPNYESQWWETFGRVVQTGIGERHEFYTEPLKSWYDFYAFRVESPENHRVAIIFKDVTAAKQNEADRQKAELELRETHVQLEAALVAGGIYTWRWNILTDRMVGNSTFAHLFGVDASIVTKEGLPLEFFINAIHEEDRPQVSAKIQQAIATGEVYTAEYRVRTATGEERWVKARGQVEYDSNGAPIAFPGALADITDRKQAEAAIQASNEQFKLLAESASNLLIVEDPKVYLATLFEKISALLQLEIYVNYFFQEDQQRLELHTYGGISEEVATAARYLELGQPVCGHAVQRRCPIVVENALEDTGPLAIPLQSLGIRAYATHPLIVGDRIVGTLGLGTYQRDYFRPDELELMQAVAAQVAAALERARLLNELQVRAEALAQANRLKDEFLAVLSHELRSPLNPILGWTRLLQGGKLDPARQTEALKTIERNAKLQAQLIEDLLDISRIMQGKLSLTAAPVNLEFVVSAAIETVRLAAEAKNIRISLNLNPVTAPVSGDATRLQQVVWNLLSNAVKFTPRGGNVTVELRQFNDIAQIRVIDNGVGISPRFLPHVFDYFRQEDGSITRKFGGLGLGLAIVRQIVEMHGGTVWADSKGENQGAVFMVQLPLGAIVNSSNLESSGDSDAIDVPLSNLRILLVDDELDTREFEAFVLEQSGASVTAVASGIEGLQVLDQFTPDVLVSDIGMAGMDGYTLIEQIRSRSSKASTIPAIALTAYASEIDQQQALQAGFQKHLAKPIEPQELIRAIAALVKKTE